MSDDLKWKKWLRASKTAGSNQISQMPKNNKKTLAERKMLFDIRKRAVRAMEDLVLIFDFLPYASKDAENDFAKIFRNEEVYFNLLRSSRIAYEESYKSKSRFLSPECRSALQLACVRANMGFPSDRKLANRRYRDKIWKELKEKKAEIFYNEAMRRIIDRKNESFDSQKK